MFSIYNTALSNPTSANFPTLHKHRRDIPIIRHKQEPLKRLLELGPPLVPRQPRRTRLADIQEKVWRPPGRHMERVEFLAREKVADRVGQFAESCSAHGGQVEERRDREWLVGELRSAVRLAVRRRGLDGEHLGEH